jgi:hypothetical protein
LAELLEVREQKMSKLGPNAKVAVFAYGENHDVNILKYDESSGFFFLLCRSSLHFTLHQVDQQ